STVIYDTLNYVISTTVIVSLLSDPLEPSVIAAPFTMPAGDWTVQWNLIAGTGIASAVFTQDNGVFVPEDQQPPIPPNVTVGPSQRNSDTQWQIEFTNAVTTVNSFKYFLQIIWTSFLSDTSNTRTGELIIHDPTIAVTQDPMT
ncbi:MAG TPA: hypothetical protein VGM86_33340, partial [Thermoanaerobaculia bacterium]